MTGFFGLDVLLLYLAFRWNYRQGRRAELSAWIRKAWPCAGSSRTARQRDWQFEPYWVRVSFDDPPRYDSQLTVASHGRRLAIGLFLTPEERLDLARALQSALRRYR